MTAQPLTIGDAVKAVRAATKADLRPWLVVGKGPSSALPVKFADYNCVTLNHACRLTTPAFAHFVDWDAFCSCREFLPVGARVLMPWRPHVRFKSTKATIESLAEPADHTYQWASYNATTSRLPRDKRFSSISLRYFSATSVFHILAAAGVKQLFSIGVDGGKQYSSAFEESTRLSNGQKSFDVQTPVLVSTCKRFGVAWTKLK